MVVSIYNNMRVVAVRLQTVRAPEFAGKHTDVVGHRVGLLSQVAAVDIAVRLEVAFTCCLTRQRCLIAKGRPICGKPLRVSGAYPEGVQLVASQAGTVPNSSLTPEKLIPCNNGILQAYKFVLALPSSELLSIGYNSLIVGGMATPTA